MGAGTAFVSLLEAERNEQREKVYFSKIVGQRERSTRETLNPVPVLVSVWRFLKISAKVQGYASMEVRSPV
jgi:hypothetical protein